MYAHESTIITEMFSLAADMLKYWNDSSYEINKQYTITLSPMSKDLAMLDEINNFFYCVEHRQ